MRSNTVKSLFLLALLLVLFQQSYAQNTYPWLSSGNVGIGTSSPLNILHLHGTTSSGHLQISGGSPSIRFLNTTPSGTVQGQIGIANTVGDILSTTLAGDMAITTPATRIRMGVSNAETMRLEGDKVAIGWGSQTVSPLFKLSIQSSSGSHLGLHGKNPMILAMSSDNTVLYGQLVFPTISNFILPGTNAGDALLVASNVFFGKDGSSTMTIKNTSTGIGQAVGIGTISPASTLHVNGGVAQVTSTNDTPDNTKSGITLGEATSYTWVQNNTAKPLALNPVPTSGTSYVAVGFTPGTYSVPSGYQLAVKGNILCEELKVKLASNWPDYVFNKSYKLMPLSQLERFITMNHHLPEVPAAKEVETNGIEVGDMNAILLKKVEELTLYMIQQDKKIEAQSKELEVLKAQLR